MSAFGVMVPIKEGILCHGGIQKPDSKNSLNTVSVLNWTSLFDGPKYVNPQVSQFGPDTGLSHHTGCLIHGGNILLLVGGWDNFLIRVCHCDFFSKPRLFNFTLF